VLAFRIFIIKTFYILIINSFSLKIGIVGFLCLKPKKAREFKHFNILLWPKAQYQAVEHLPTKCEAQFKPQYLQKKRKIIYIYTYGISIYIVIGYLLV
jgi:hypothetical protein